jgi:hypothetical protein
LFKTRAYQPLCYYSHKDLRIRFHQLTHKFFLVFQIRNRWSNFNAPLFFSSKETSKPVNLPVIEILKKNFSHPPRSIKTTYNGFKSIFSLFEIIFKSRLIYHETMRHCDVFFMDIGNSLRFFMKSFSCWGYLSITRQKLYLAWSYEWKNNTDNSRLFFTSMVAYYCLVII